MIPKQASSVWSILTKQKKNYDSSCYLSVISKTLEIYFLMLFSFPLPKKRAICNDDRLIKDRDLETGGYRRHTLQGTGALPPSQHIRSSPGR